jgi:hypothetical protein
MKSKMSFDQAWNRLTRIIPKVAYFDLSKRRNWRGGGACWDFYCNSIPGFRNGFSVTVQSYEDNALEILVRKVKRIMIVRRIKASLKEAEKVSLSEIV